MTLTVVLPEAASGATNAGVLQFILSPDVPLTDSNVSASLHWN